MLALFPLNLIAYPDEEVNLHIFEPRYKELIKDCLEKEQTFGIPVFMDKQVQRVGTEMKIVELVNQYSDGRMDIRSKGIGIFQILDFVNPMENKLHAGGEIERIKNIDDADIVQKLKLIATVQELYEIVKIPFRFETKVTHLSFLFAHKIGLSLQKEYILLTMPSESQRIDFLIDHLQQSIPVMRDMEKTKERIKMNGHFKHLDPIKF